ncbi:MAG: type II toxin-antitoxin system RelE/ParE family toxin [Deltaproteobacteria bacterium]|nr:type II toxin-antitoxin system RelE/ParE family toxin [Deltaproteobacteria bacterium]
MKVLEYLSEDGKSPFGIWFEKLDSQAAAKITAALVRLRCGNTSKVKSIGEGVQEYKIDWGPGYRIYFGFDGKTLVILVGGGTKRKQVQDIKAAKERWADYKKRKKGEKRCRSQKNSKIQLWLASDETPNFVQN